jgi:hypothetical protein
LDATQLLEGQQSVKQESKQDIVLRLTESLNAQQRSVPQLPADAQARKIKVLGSKTDPRHPFAGYMVGADESADPGRKRIGPDMSDPYEQGWFAGSNDTNPYAAGTAEHRQWQAGNNEKQAQPNHYDESLAEVDFNPGRRGFLKKAGAVAATAAMPTGMAGAAAKAVAPAASWASTLSAPLAGLTAIDLDDIINLLMSQESKNPSYVNNAAYDPYDLDTIKKIAEDASLNSWGNSWFMNGNAAQALLEAIDMCEKKGMDDEDIIDHIFIVTKKQYMQELKQLSPEEVAKVKSQSLNPDNKSEPAASPTTGISSLARAAGTQIGRTMKNIGKATANTVLNQPARDMGRIEPTTAPAALPAPSVSPGMQIPKQKSRVAASPFNDDHSELDQFVKEEFNRDPDDINEESGAVVAHGYAYNRQDQRVAWTREFASEAEATEWARRRNATVLSIVPKDSIEEGWKSKLAGAALAGAAAFGGGGAQANDQIAKDTQAITQAIQSGQMKPRAPAAGEISLSQIHSHPKWLETVQAMIKKYPKNHEDDQRAMNAAREAIKQMIQQGNVREGAGTVGGNNPAAAWPDFGTAKTYESQLAEAKQRLAEGARVDRMVRHIASSEKATGKSNKDAENIAWATVNKRGYLDNKNKKKHVAEAGTPADIRAKNRAVVKKIQGKEADIDEGLKSKLAGAVLAGAAALGGGAAVAGSQSPNLGIDQFNQPTAVQTAPRSGVPGFSNTSGIDQFMKGADLQTTPKAGSMHVDDRSWDTSGYDDHIKSDTKLTKTTTPDGKVSRDSQRRISSVQGPNAQGEYRVFVGQNGKIVSSYVTKTPPQNWMVKEDITQEDIITKLKAKLGDYLSDLGQQIKKDPALQDKLSAKPPGDQVGPPVKTLTTDDGHEISIHGNEDDGFRISIKNKQTPSKFDSLDEAVMACEMYRAHRRRQELTADYVEEA